MAPALCMRSAGLKVFNEEGTVISGEGGELGCPFEGLFAASDCSYLGERIDDCMVRDLLKSFVEVGRPTSSPNTDWG